jgi:hypothetical protein
MKIFFLPKNLSRIVYHPFQNLKNINRNIPNIQDIKNIFKKKTTWDEPIKTIQPLRPNSK